MARKIILKEDGLNGSGNSPSGYKYLGDNAGTISQKVGPTVSGIGGAVSEYTETIVNISSAQILAMGTTPIELLPAAGANSYYDINKVVLEYTYGNSAYAVTDDFQIKDSDGSVVAVAPSYLLVFTQDVAWTGSLRNQLNAVSSPTGYNYGEAIILNSAYTISCTNPTLGDGTLRVKIYYKVITFGA
jgi:hypothetical protein